MKLFAANVSNHEQQLWYRLPGPNGGNAAPHTIPLGTQNVVLNSELDEGQVNAFMSQMERYGMVHMDDAAGYSKCIAVLFSRDKPVPQKIIDKYVRINKGILTEEGEDRRTEMAVVDMNSIGSIQEGAGRTMDLSVEEEPGTITKLSGSRPLGEGYSAPESHMAKVGAKPMAPRRNGNPRGGRR